MQTYSRGGKQNTRAKRGAMKRFKLTIWWLIYDNRDVPRPKYKTYWFRTKEAAFAAYKKHDPKDDNERGINLWDSYLCKEIWPGQRAKPLIVTVVHCWDDNDIGF